MDDEDDYNTVDNIFSADVKDVEPRIESPMAIKVAEHYNARANQTYEERQNSPIIHLKKLNNWVKNVMIKMYGGHNFYVLDLACGKGGDLTKWEKQNLALYVGVDIALGSVNDARVRYNGDTNLRKNRPMHFPAKFVHADCFGVSLSNALRDFAPFDAISCQFAFHYSFQNESRAHTALRNISEALRPGGIFFGTMPDANVLVKKLRASPDLEFGNKVYNINFRSLNPRKTFPDSKPYGIQYDFKLEDAVDCPEWLVPFSFLQNLCLKFDLHLELKSNFHEFIHKQSTSKEHSFLMRKILGEDWDSKITEDEWDAAYLYTTFAFRKQGTSKPTRNKMPPVPDRIEEDDIIIV